MKEESNQTLLRLPLSLMIFRSCSQRLVLRARLLLRLQLFKMRMPYLTKILQGLNGGGKNAYLHSLQLSFNFKTPLLLARCLIFMILVSLENVKKYSHVVARLLGMGEHQKVRVSSELEHVVFRKVRVSSELEHLMVEHIRVRASMIEHPSEYQASLKIEKNSQMWAGELRLFYT